MKKISAWVGALLCAASLCPCSPALRASANSAQSFWFGRDSHGAYVLEGDCPVVVEREKLVFDIHTYPRPYEYESSLSYDASVTAEYVFFNPSELDISATLVFPFGEMPEYFYGLSDPNTEQTFNDSDRYAIQMDGQEIDFSLRHTYCDSFELNTQLERLKEQPAFSEESPVRIYTFSAPSVFFENDKKYPVEITAHLSAGDPQRTCVLFDRWNGMGVSEEGETVSLRPADDVFTMTVFGAPLKEMPVFDACCLVEHGPAVELRPCDVAVTLLSEEETDFSNYLLSFFDEKEGVGFRDFLRAASDMLSEERKDGMLSTGARLNRLYERLMRWYEYELRLPAGGSAVNRVTAPIYPHIDYDYDVPVYSYSYLLSPAATWKEFGTFEVELFTEYYVVDGSLAFENREKEYVFAQEGLPPAGELTFSLSQSESPKRNSHFGRTLMYVFAFFIVPIALGIFCLAVVVGLIILIVYAIRKRKNSSPKGPDA